MNPINLLPFEAPGILYSKENFMLYGVCHHQDQTRQLADVYLAYQLNNTTLVLRNVPDYES